MGQYEQNTQQHTTAVLLVNLGTPEQLTAAGVRNFLGRLLRDQRVVEHPRLLWWPILYGIVLPFRAKKTLANYHKVWLPNGSPLMEFCKALATALRNTLHENGNNIDVHLAMSYCQPYVTQVTAELVALQYKKIIVLPLYPQYAQSTCAAVFDQITRALHAQKYIPSISFIHGYHDHSLYIQALAAQVRAFQQTHGVAEYLLISYHGIPQKVADGGDPYYDCCQETTRLLCKELALEQAQYAMVFQSRFGMQQWLQPYCDATIIALAAAGIRHIQVLCPGFAVDCVETLEEISISAKKLFVAHGGTSFAYIPCLNDKSSHAELLAALVQAHD